MPRLICEKCGKELDPKTLIANNVYNCPKCGLVKTALLGYANKGLVSFDIAEAVTEIEVSDEGLISFSPSDKPTDANETSKYMTKEEIEKHNAKIDEQVKAMDGFLDDLFS